ncbi:MAG: 2Fe-2S iron-sulfur cluster binding domain-containing protein [Bacteroidia bacterium]|nr:2Fe-2S iron-sulfur cluster binding domain-containing protein [Bacteroidia bacterium]
MPNFVIDGKTYEYEGNPRLLQWCIDNGIEIPYFCYHPAMSSPTNCRMCLVEVGFPVKDRATGAPVMNEDGTPQIMWGRKPATSCNQSISPDMVVRTNRTSPEVKKMQEGVLEYMLINHPLDCPICDQAGECPLQIWTYKYGPEGSRFTTAKAHRPKRVELGPNVILDAERCINCTRCTRFTEEISETHQLSIAGRGEKNYPSTAPGKQFDDPYSMNVIDLCPVGALTSRDFRFAARVWEMSYTPSIDMNDSTGTNTNVWVRDNKVMRITPRENLAVNDYWMPDAHRLNTDMYNEKRVSGVKSKGDVPVDFVEGLAKIGKLLKSQEGHIFFLGSAYASLESNYMLAQLAKKVGVTSIHYVSDVRPGYGDDWLIQDDRTPNAAACELLGFHAITLEHLQSKLKHGDIKFLYSLENDRAFGLLYNELENVHVVAHANQYQPVFEKLDWILPAATAIEGEGTYINYKGIPQVTKMAKEIQQMTPEMWMRLSKSRLDKAAVAVDKWRNLENVFDVLPSWQIIAQILRSMGQEVSYREHKDIFAKLKAEYDILRDLKVDYKVPKEAFKISQFDFAIT